MRRRNLIAGASSLLAGAAGVGTDRGGTTLRSAARARNISFGSEITVSDIMQSSSYADLVARECEIITPGIEAKWAYTEPAEGFYKFAPMDRIARFVAENGLKLHMHNLIWAVGLPRWTIDAISEGRAAGIVADHIAALVGRYQDRVESWDVINEPVDPRWPSSPEGYCTTPWRRALGPGFAELALRDAALANPRAHLLINDDDLEYDAPDREQKRTTYLRLIEALKRRGVPLHGFGLEAHLKPWLPIADIAYRRFLADLAGFDLTIYVTELDVCDRQLAANIMERDLAVAALTRHYLDIVLDEPATKTVICWGLSDRWTWMLHDPAGQRADGLPPRPSPYDVELTAKPMRAAILSAFQHARMRSAS